MEGDSCLSTLSQGNESSSKSGLNGGSRRHFLASKGVTVATPHRLPKGDRILPVAVNRDLVRGVTSQHSSRAVSRSFLALARSFRAPMGYSVTFRFPIDSSALNSARLSLAIMLLVAREDMRPPRIWVPTYWAPKASIKSTPRWTFDAGLFRETMTTLENHAPSHNRTDRPDRQSSMRDRDNSEGWEIVEVLIGTFMSIRAINPTIQRVRLIQHGAYPRMNRIQRRPLRDEQGGGFW